MEANHKPIRLWIPEQLATYIGVLCFKVLNLLPWPVLRKVGTAIGLVFYHLIPIRKRIVQRNIALAFPSKTKAEHKALARAHYISMGMGLMETCRAWWSPNSKLPRHTIEGMENLDLALKKGRGALMLTAHMTTLEIGGRMLVERHPFGCFYRDPNNPVIATIMRKRRTRTLSAAVHFDDLRGLVRALKAGHAMWYAPDQSKRTKISEILPFFGEPAITNTATSRIAQMSGCPVVPFVGYRKSDGDYHIVVLPALENFPSGDHTADSILINHVVESLILRAPDQYLWMHKRYKARGPEYPDAYADHAKG